MTRYRVIRYGLMNTTMEGSYRWRWLARLALAIAPYEGKIREERK